MEIISVQELVKNLEAYQEPFTHTAEAKAQDMEYDVETIKAWCLQHVNAALRLASEQAELDLVNGYKGAAISSISILNAYPKENIK